MKAAPDGYTLLLVGPAAQRQVIAGPDGLSYLVVGAVVEGAGT